MLSQVLFESSEKIFERSKKFVWTFLYFHYYGSKLKVEILIYISVYRSEAILQNVLLLVFFVFRQDASIFDFSKY
jgi:hypothetical protein